MVRVRSGLEKNQKQVLRGVMQMRPTVRVKETSRPDKNLLHLFGCTLFGSFLDLAIGAYQLLQW